MAKQPKDIAASVRQRLLNLAREEGQVFDVVLVAFGLERLVYRLSVSEYRDRFVLKGGMLVTLWTADTGRFTRDIDFLAFGSDEETQLKEAFSAILAIDGRDGLIGVGLAPCSFRARLLGFSFEGRALPLAMMFNSFATSCGVISVTSFRPQCGATSLVSIERWSDALVRARCGTCSSRYRSIMLLNLGASRNSPRSPSGSRPSSISRRRSRARSRAAVTVHSGQRPMAMRRWAPAKR